MNNQQSRIDIREKMLQEMRKYFGADKLRIQHAEKVLEYAEKILEQEQGTEKIVVASAILHDIGIKECERKYNSTNGQLQEKEGPPIAEKILRHLNTEQEIIDEVCKIIGSHHSPGEVNSLNFKILWDSDWLVNIKDEYDINDKIKMKRTINRVFLTGAGRRLAQKIYL